ncbi:MAG: EAL domain-containing protein [Gammaproteobacteria bacterium]|nr:EAL domain-containing protein [Gammaproteobacteria bacterium]
MHYRNLSGKVYIYTAILILVIALISLSYTIFGENKQFEKEQRKIAQSVVHAVKHNLNQFMIQKRKDVQGLVEYERDLLNDINNMPGDKEKLLRLQHAVENRFSDFYSYMIADPKGKPLLSEKLMMVGKNCQASLQQFSNSTELFQEEMLIHGSGSNNYHFDVMRKINSDKNSAIFFVSFRLNKIVQLLKLSQTPGVSLIILMNSGSVVVEISSEGVRHSTINGKGNELAEITGSSILYEDIVPGTKWRILALPHDTLYANHDASMVKRIFYVFLILSLIIGVFLWRLRNEEKLRIVAESKFSRSNEQRDSEIKQRDQERAEKEQCFENAFMSAPYGMLISSNDGIIESVNQQAETIFGYKQEEIKGKNVEFLMPERFRKPHTDQRDQYNHQQAKKVMGNGRNLFGLRSNGEEFPIEIGLNPIEHSKGKKIVVSMTDVTKFVDAQERLMEEHERAIVTLSSIGDGVITTDIHGVIDSINSIAEKLTGWNSCDAIGRKITKVFHVINERTDERLDDTVTVCLKNKTIAQNFMETVLINKKGVNIPVQESAAPIHNVHGVIIGAVLVFHDITQMRNYAHEIEYQANHDALTGLLNRREFDNRLNNTLNKELSSDNENVLLYLDLDRFKMINDTAGHSAGDELLKQLTQIISAKLRKRDTFARLGGDEFGILLEHCSLDTGHSIALDLCQAVEDFRFFWNKRKLSISISIGMLPFSPKDSADELLSKADAACYTAKKSGRNRVQVYDAIAAKKHDESHIVSMLTHAFENDLMILYQQQIEAVNGQDGHRHYEVLVRMFGDNNEIIPPDVFLPSAERYGLATTLDRWVVRKTFSWLFEHLADFTDVPCLSINLSAQSITDELFGEFVREQFILYQINPRHICFEITETAVMYDIESAVHFINDLKSIGCQFSLDDFGSGHAAYAQLKHLPVDFLKIDGSLIKDIIKDKIDYSIVRSVNDVGHVLGMKTIAEFVENDQIFKKLSELRVDYLQGYEIARPAPLDELLDK